MANAGCIPVGGTFECSGLIWRQAIYYNTTTYKYIGYTSDPNKGFMPYGSYQSAVGADLKVHISADGVVVNNGAGAAWTSDGFSNNGGGVVNSLHVLNDGKIIAYNLGGSNFAVDLSLAPAANLGATTFDNNGLIQGSQAAFSVLSRDLFTLNNSASGIVTATDKAVSVNAVGTLINNYGRIERTTPGAGSFAINSTNNASRDILNLYSGHIKGDVFLNGSDDAFDWYGGDLEGLLNLGTGSDKATVHTSNFSPDFLFDGGDDVSVTDGWIDTLKFSGITVTATGGNLQNWENIVVDSDSMLSFSDNALTTSSDAGYGLFINNGGTVNGAAPGNAFTINGNVTNAGTLAFSDGVANDTFTINGDYATNGGTIKLDTVLGGDGSATDLLVVNGNTTGSGWIAVNNINGTGAQTVAGIKIMDITGSSGADFTLIGDYTIHGQQAIAAGAYAYTLNKNGVSTPTDGDWYLRSELKPTQPVDPKDPTSPVAPTGPAYNPVAPVSEAYPQILLGLNGLPTLQQRVGNRFWSGSGADSAADGANAVEEDTDTGVPASFIKGRGIWGRIEGQHVKFAPDASTTGANYDYDTLKLQAGVDFLLNENDKGSLIGGVTAHYVHALADVYSIYGNGDISTHGYGLGSTLTWYGKNGFYVDTQGQYTWYDSDLSSDTAIGSIVKDNDGSGYSLSIEAGKRIELHNFGNGGWTITPQAQLQYSAIDFDTFTKTFGGHRSATISLGDGDSLRGRLGVTLDNEASWQAENGTVRRHHVYAIANLYNEFLDGTSVDVSGASLANRSDRLWGSLGLGGSYNWNDDKYSVYGEAIAYTSLNSFGDSYAIKGTVGLRIKW